MRLSNDQVEFIKHKIEAHLPQFIANVDIASTLDKKNRIFRTWLNDGLRFDQTCELESKYLPLAQDDSGVNVLSELRYEGIPIELKTLIVTIGSFELSKRAAEIESLEAQKRKDLEDSAAIEEKNRRDKTDLDRARKDSELREQIEAERAFSLEENRLRAEKHQNEKVNLANIKRLKNEFRLGLEKDYLHTISETDRFLEQGLTSIDTDNEVSTFVQAWCSRFLNLTTVDHNQALAIGVGSQFALAIARAGSGKTTVISARVAFLVGHCGIHPNQILVMAFNTKAYEEIENRIRLNLANFKLASSMAQRSIEFLPKNTPASEVKQIVESHNFQVPWIGNFDKIALQVIDGSQSESDELHLVDEAEQREVINELIREMLSTTSGEEMLRKVMLQHFRDDWDFYTEAELTQEQKRALSTAFLRETLRREKVKSHGEKLIADWLFEHRLDYKYEAPLKVSGNWLKPDFTIEVSPGKYLVIEYAGLIRDPEYAKQLEKKVAGYRAAGMLELSIFPDEIASGSFSKKLEFHVSNHLEQDVVDRKMTEEEVWLEIRDHAQTRFSKLVKNFIERAESSTDLGEKALPVDLSSDPVALQFTEIAFKLFSKYKEVLKQRKKEDFKQRLQRATRLLNSGSITARKYDLVRRVSDLKFILVDEFQDYSPLYDEFVLAIQLQSSHASIFAVGDDWQAINSFMGADLDIFHSFETRMPDVKKLEITTNYRSSSSIVHAGNHLMAQTGGALAKVNNPTKGKVEILNPNTLVLTETEQEEFGFDKTSAGVFRLIEKVLGESPDSKVTLLNRKNDIAWWYKDKFSAHYGTDLENYLRFIKENLPKQLRSRVKISTVHKFKGLEDDNIIIFDANEMNFPLIHKDDRFLKYFGNSFAGQLAEERRLFYVALTRAKNATYILANTETESRFLKAIRASRGNWSDYSNAIQVICTGSALFQISETLKRANFKYQPSNKAWVLTIPDRHFSGDDADLIQKITSSRKPWAQAIRGLPRISVTLRINLRDYHLNF